VQSLLTSEPPSPTRGALFEDDVPLTSHKIPGNLHHADDEHIQRLIARHGAVNLVRQLAQDLAHRNAQMASLRRRADDRERALRKIILECGLSSLDLETRLRAIEQEAKANGKKTEDNSLAEMMSDAMADDLRNPYLESLADVTIRASSVPLSGDTTRSAGGRGWKEYLWGTGGVKKKSAVVKATAPERRPPLQEDLFVPPNGTETPREASRPGSSHSKDSKDAARKPSLASLALRLVAGGGSATRDAEPRGRAASAQGGTVRTPSNASIKTTASSRSVSTNDPKSLMAMRRGPAGAAAIRPIAVASRMQASDRWDTMATTPETDLLTRSQSYGPVEMDTILPPEDQPPTLTNVYNNHAGAEFLTDRFGFIYDQRRKKRQRDAAAQIARHLRKGSRAEVANGRGPLSPTTLWDDELTGEPQTEGSAGQVEEQGDKQGKRWQDYLKIATFPTELLSNMPSIGSQSLEVIEAAEGSVKTPGSTTPSITPEERGFLPTAATTTTATVATAINSEVQSESDQAQGTLAKEDADAVRQLLESLNQLHDTLQREKTVRWNDFLRKVRAERRRDGQAAAAAAAQSNSSTAASDPRLQRATASILLPEARLGDGELIGVASLGLQGKMGRAKAAEFHSLLLGGIPVAYRAKIWAECSGARALRVPGYYDSLVARTKDPSGGDGTGDVDPTTAAQIAADIPRTLTDNVFFRPGRPGVARLREVLLAYSLRNPSVGYCQGMNLVVANLLLIVPSAEEAFWILASLIESILPQEYFTHTLLASRADQSVLRSFVSMILPKLDEHFRRLGVDLETMTFQWFLSLFTDVLSAEALFRVWDVVLCEPHDRGAFLFQVALALLKLNENLLLRCESAAEVYMLINHGMVTDHAISIDGLVQASEGLRRWVRREEVESRRRRAVEGERGREKREGGIADRARDEAERRGFMNVGGSQQATEGQKAAEGSRIPAAA